MEIITEGGSEYGNLTEIYETVISNIREVLFQLDTRGNILYINKAWELMTGFTVQESNGKNLLDYLMPDELHGVCSNHKTKSLSGELFLVTKDLKTKIIEYFISPLLNDRKELYGYSGSMLDVTEKKHQESLMIAGKKYVETLNRDLELRIKKELDKNRHKDHILIQQSRLAAMGEMIASIGHQWRQPLNNLSLLIQDVREAREFGEIDDLYIDRFTMESMVQIKHMSRTINDFRNFYRPNKEKSIFSLAESIEDVLAIFSSSLKNHIITIKFEYRGRQMAYGYPNEFSQVVLNILTNARDAFVQNCTENRKIVIRIFEKENYMVSEFVDNAGGIDPLLIPKIFDPYFTTRPHGTGLGLYMTKMILENMEGFVEVKNTEDGAKFSLFIPCLKFLS